MGKSQKGAVTKNGVESQKGAVTQIRVVTQKGVESQKGEVTQIGVVTQKGVESQKGAVTQIGVATQSWVVVQKGAKFEEVTALGDSVGMSGVPQCMCRSFSECGISLPGSNDGPQMCTVMLHREGAFGRLDSESQVTLTGTPLVFSLTEKNVRVHCKHGVTVNYAVDTVVFEGTKGGECQGGGIPRDLVYAWERGRDFLLFDDIWSDDGDASTVGPADTETVTAPDMDRSEVELTRGRSTSAQLTDLTSRDKTDGGLGDETTGLDTLVLDGNWRVHSTGVTDPVVPFDDIIKEVVVRHVLAKREQDHEIQLIKETVTEHVERERVLRQAAEHRVDELEKEVSELRGHLSACKTMNKTLLEDMEVLREAQEKHQQEILRREDQRRYLAEERDKVLQELSGVVKGLLQKKWMGEDVQRPCPTDSKAELPKPILEKGPEDCKSQEDGEPRAAQDSHPVLADTLREVSVENPEPSVQDESKSMTFKCVMEVPEDVREACASEGVHETFKKAVKAYSVSWAPETDQLVILAETEDTERRVAVLKEMHLQCLRTKQMLVERNRKAARRLELAREAQSRLGFVEDIIPVPRNLVGKVVGRLGKVMQEMVNRSCVKRVRIPPAGEIQVVIEDDMVPFIVVGSVESIGKLRMLLEYRVAYLKEIEQLRQDRLQMNEQIENVRWRPPPTQGVRARRDPPRNERTGSRRQERRESASGRSNRSNIGTRPGGGHSDRGSDSDQPVGPAGRGTHDSVNWESRPVRERSGDGAHCKQVETKECLITLTDVDGKAKAQGRDTDRWGRGRPNVNMRQFDYRNRRRWSSRLVGQDDMGARSQDTWVMSCVQPHKFEQRGEVCGVVTTVSARGRCVGVPGRVYRHIQCGNRSRVLNDHCGSQGGWPWDAGSRVY
ncbi:uncharacterized protein [Dendrobates tinctorius]|uniref:uncharacterized protein n=1 Tax=Dendrobates tinctorius TaxID=92724 RepID=UPI003CC954FC